MGLGLQKKKQIIFSYFPKPAMLSIFLYFLLLLFRKHLYAGALSNLPRWYREGRAAITGCEGQGVDDEDPCVFSESEPPPARGPVSHWPLSQADTGLTMSLTQYDIST